MEVSIGHPRTKYCISHCHVWFPEDTYFASRLLLGNLLFELSWEALLKQTLHSGNVLRCYWTWSYIYMYMHNQVSFPFKHGGSFNSSVNVYQRVNSQLQEPELLWLPFCLAALSYLCCTYPRIRESFFCSVAHFLRPGTVGVVIVLWPCLWRW